MSKIAKKRYFSKRVKNDQKTSKKAKNGPNPKTVRGVSWYPQNRHFSSKLHSGKTPKSRKIGQKSPFFRGPKNTKNRPFLDPVFLVVIVLSIVIIKFFNSWHFIAVNNVQTCSHIVVMRKNKPLFGPHFSSLPAHVPSHVEVVKKTTTTRPETSNARHQSLFETSFKLRIDANIFRTVSRSCTQSKN